MTLDEPEEEVLSVPSTGYGASMDASSRTDSFDALLVELVGELDATHPALSDLGRFEVTAMLGEGGFGSVYAATDTRDGREVALKVLRRGSADALLRFKREFRSLSDVRHRNLVQLHELLQVGDKWLLSMERVEGEPFDTYVARHPEKLRATLGQLVEGVAALHGAGKLHRDLKPSNVLVEDGGRVVILDFGLVRERSDDGSTVLAGTPAFMSPEQCAEGELGPASDWYAVGVMLYQALSGRLPFEGAMLEVMQAKQAGEAPAIEGVGGAMAGLARRLLARDPEARPRGAELLELLEASAPEVPSTGAVFVGRRRELGWLGERLGQCRPQLLTVVGPPGIGKTTLVRRALRDAPERLVFRGRCHPRESVPFKAFDEVVDAIARFLAKTHQPEVYLPRDAGALAVVFPVLRDRCGAARGGGDRAEARRRAFAALRELLARLAEHRPVILAIDDVHWGDGDSATLLVELLQGPGAAPVTVLTTRRDEEGATMERLNQLERQGVVVPREELRLEPLVAEDARALAIAHADDEVAAERALREAEGHPQQIEQLARYGGTGGFAALLRARVEAAPPRGREALRLVAIAGFPLPEPWLLQALTPDAADAVDAMVRDRLLRRAPRGLLPHHDRVAEVILAELSEEARCRKSRELAEACPSPEAEAERVATLFEAADDPRAAPYLLRAGRQAAAQLAFRRASTLLVRARAQRQRHGLADVSEGSLDVELAEALRLAGSATDAAAAYARAAARHPEEEEAAKLRAMAGNELVLTARLVPALEQWGMALGALGVRLPRSNTEAGAELVRQSVRRWWPRRARPSPSARVRARALYEASWMLQFMQPVVGAALAATLRAEAATTRDPYPRFLAAGAEALSVAIRRGGGGHAEALTILRRAHREVAPLDIGGVEQTSRFLEAWIHCYGFDMASGRRAFEELLAMPVGREGLGAELTLARVGLGTALLSLGDPSLGRFGTSMVVEAEERDQLVLQLLGRMYELAFVPEEHVHGLAANVRELAQEARARGFDLVDIWTRVFEAGMALMRDDAERAYGQAHASVITTHALRALGTRYHYLESVHLQGRAALWLAVRRPGRRRPLLAEAEGHAATLRAEVGAYPEVWGLALEAGVASFDEGADRVLGRLHALHDAARRGGYASHAALAAHALRRRSHDPDRFPDGLTQLSEAGVTDPVVFARYYLPGRFAACGL